MQDVWSSFFVRRYMLRDLSSSVSIIKSARLRNDLANREADSLLIFFRNGIFPPAFVEFSSSWSSGLLSVTDTSLNSENVDTWARELINWHAISTGGEKLTSFREYRVWTRKDEGIFLTFSDLMTLWTPIMSLSPNWFPLNVVLFVGIGNDDTIFPSVSLFFYHNL